MSGFKQKHVPMTFALFVSISDIKLLAEVAPKTSHLFQLWSRKMLWQLLQKGNLEILQRNEIYIKYSMHFIVIHLV